MIGLWLRVEGYGVLTATNGQEALSQIEETRPDLIVLDLQMPVMDGETFYRTIRETGLDVPVVVVSAYGAHDTQDRIHADAVLDKPFMPERLLATVDELLHRD
jgi:two-component system response regulator MprA